MFHALCEDIIAETTFAACLKRRTVGAVCHSVVFPGEVVVAFLELPSPHERVNLSRLASHCLEGFHAMSHHRNGENQHSVAGHLRRHFISSIVQQTEREMAELVHFPDIDFRHFIVAVFIERIVHP